MVNKSRRKFLTNSFLAAAGFVLLDALFLERYLIQVKKYQLGPATNDKISFVQISDLHLKKFGFKHRIITKKINSLKPDFICLTGDAIEKADRIDEFEKFIKALDPAIPKKAILGNWEYWGKVSFNKLQKVYRKYNCELLVNQSKILKIGKYNVAITGVDDLLAGKPDFKTSFNRLNSYHKHIVLSHCPAYFDTIKKEYGLGVMDICLSGHTHGGQINFFGFIPFKPGGSGEYLKGFYHDKKLYVSKGIGYSFLPMRFMARAEVAYFEMGI